MRCRSSILTLDVLLSGMRWRERRKSGSRSQSHVPLRLASGTADATKLAWSFNTNNFPSPFSIPNVPFLLHNTLSQHFTMDTLVAQYSKPMFEKENYNQDDQVDLYNPAPSLSLRFAMPPIAQVSCSPSPTVLNRALGAHRPLR